MRKREGFISQTALMAVALLQISTTAPTGCVGPSVILPSPVLESANPERRGDGYFERSFSMSLRGELLDTIERIAITVPEGENLLIEGTDATDEGDLSLPLHINVPGGRAERDQAVQDWLDAFTAHRKIQDHALDLQFPSQFCRRTLWGIEGVCVGKIILRTPKQKLIDLTATGWNHAELKAVRARTLDLTAPTQGTLRMNGTLANVVLRGGGNGFHAMIENILAADPSNPDAGNISAHLNAFRTLILTRIQGQIRIDAVTQPDPEQFLRVDDREIQNLPFARD